MVLQQGGPAHVWGWATPGEQVSVRFASQQQMTTTDEGGRWSVWLNDLRPSDSGELVIEGKNKITIRDVVAGEVWVASGQSNMERALHYSLDADRVMARSANSMLRLFIVNHAVASVPAEDVQGVWVLANANSVKNFSAAAYFFGEKLQSARKVPVGVIESNFGGTKIEAWMSADSINRNPQLSFVTKEWADVLAKMPHLMTDWQDKTAAWRQTATEADRASFDAGKPVAGAPAKPRGVGSQAQPTGLYNGMIAPLMKYSIRGVIWNQGENNNNSAHGAYYYRDLFTTMIEDWRQGWGEGNFPFFFVQLSRYKSNGTYPLLRESQMKGLSLVNTGMAVTADLGMVGDVHYPDKEPQGERLFRLAEHRVYGVPVADSGPLVRELTREGNTLRVWFDSTDGGLLLKAAPVPIFGLLTQQTPPELTADGKSVTLEPVPPEAIANAFQVAGSDGVFYPGTAHIDGQTLLVTSTEVSIPEQVCYGWEDRVPAMILWNGAGLPASPFRIALKPRKEPACPGAINSPTPGIP